MDPILEQIYSTIIPSAPFIIAAYALIWLTLFVYVLIIMRTTRRAQAQITILEEALASDTFNTTENGECVTSQD
jgi:CcmD family protein